MPDTFSETGDGRQGTPGRWGLGPLAAYMARPHAELASRILSDAVRECLFVMGSWARQHSLLCVLDHCAERGDDAGTLAEIGATFRSMEPTLFLQEWMGFRGCGLTKLFNRLGAERPAALGEYRKLVSIFRADGVGAGTLRHMQTPTFEQIGRLHQMPDWMRFAAALDLEKRHTLGFMQIAGPLRAQGHLSMATIEALLRGSRATDPFMVFTKAGFNFALPDPPWPGNATLRSLIDTEDLAATADRFQNCLKVRCRDAIEGRSHFYVWEGEEPAVVELGRHCGFDWAVIEIAGVRNRQVSDVTRGLIESAMPLDWLDREIGPSVRILPSRSSAGPAHI